MKDKNATGTHAASKTTNQLTPRLRCTRLCLARERRWKAAREALAPFRPPLARIRASTPRRRRAAREHSSSQGRESTFHQQHSFGASK
eukprot:scaffold4944_cov209-Pinguiococcus_pyrenoidosus.AAC.7